MAREKYYAFECKNAFYEGKLFPVAYFKSEEEAKGKAADLEAILFKYEYENGVCVAYDCIYDPFGNE